MIEKLLRFVLNEGELIDKKEIAQNAYHLTIYCKVIQKVNYKPGQHLRIFVGDTSNAAGKNSIRTYSIWKIDRENCLIHIAACSHTQGPGSNWVRSIQPGEKVLFSSPKGRFTLDSSYSNYYFIGDSSSLGHLYELQRNLGGNKKSKGIIYASNKEELFPDINDKSPFDFYAFNENPVQEIENLIQESPNPDTSIYIGGDGRLCLTLNRVLRKKGWHYKSIKTKAFWHPDKKGLE